MRHSEYNSFMPIFLIWILPFLAYYLGIVIRKYAWSDKNSPSLMRQFLMAIPICLVVVAPLIKTLDSGGQLSQHFSGYLFTIGIIIEHGMLMQKKITEVISGGMLSDLGT